MAASSSTSSHSSSSMKVVTTSRLAPPWVGLTLVSLSPRCLVRPVLSIMAPSSPGLSRSTMWLKLLRHGAQWSVTRAQCGSWHYTLLTSDWGLAAWHLRRPVCPWPAGTWQTPASWAPPRVCCCTSEAAPDPRQFLSELAASARQSCPAPALQTVFWPVSTLMNIQCTHPGQCADISWGTPSAPLSCPCRRWPAWPWGASPPGCWPRPPPPAATRPSSSVTWSSGESRAGSPAPAPTHWSLTWTSAPSGSWRPPCSSSSTSTKSKVQIKQYVIIEYVTLFFESIKKDLRWTFWMSLVSLDVYSSPRTVLNFRTADRANWVLEDICNKRFRRWRFILYFTLLNHLEYFACILRRYLECANFSAWKFLLNPSHWYLCSPMHFATTMWNNLDHLTPTFWFCRICQSWYHSNLLSRDISQKVNRKWLKVWNTLRLLWATSFFPWKQKVFVKVIPIYLH